MSGRRIPLQLTSSTVAERRGYSSFNTSTIVIQRSREILQDQATLFWSRDRGHGQKWWLQLCRSIVGKQSIQPAHRIGELKLRARCCNGASARSSQPYADDSR